MTKIILIDACVECPNSANATTEWRCAFGETYKKIPDIMQVPPFCPLSDLPLPDKPQKDG